VALRRGLRCGEPLLREGTAAFELAVGRDASSCGSDEEDGADFGRALSLLFGNLPERLPISKRDFAIMKEKIRRAGI